MIRLLLEDNVLVVRADAGDFAPRDENQLAYWEVEYEETAKAFVFNGRNTLDLIGKLVTYFDRVGLQCSLEGEAQVLFQRQQEALGELGAALDQGRQLKNGTPDIEQARDFLAFLESSIRRPLKDHQYKAALHLLATQCDLKPQPNGTVPKDR